MTHLSPEALVDLAEGLGDQSSAAHVAGCADCRRQMAELRGAMAAAARVEVPEPSPLFWDHLSARVREAVEAEGSPAPWWQPSTWPRFAMPALTGAVALLAAVLIWSPRVMAPEHATPVGATAAAADPSAPASPALPALPVSPALPALGDPAADPALDLVADLAAQMDFDSASEVAMSAHAGAVDEAFGELSADEREAAQQLLRELGQPGI